MPRDAAITYEDVARACVRLIGRAKHPSVDALYEELGRRGSKTTVHKHQKAFLKQFQEQGMSMLPAALPEALLPAIEEFWSEALLSAGKTYSEHEQEWAGKLADMERQLEEKNAAMAKQAEALEQSRLDLEAVHQEKVTAEEHAADLKSQLRNKDSLVESLRSDKERLYDQIRHEREEAQLRHDRTVEDHLAERETLKEALESLKEQRRADNEKQEKLTDYWAMQVADARDQMSAIKEDLANAKKAHSRDLSIEQTKVADLANRLERARDSLEESQQAQLDLSKENAEITRQYHGVVHRLEECERHNASLAQQLEEAEQSIVEIRQSEGDMPPKK